MLEAARQEKIRQDDRARLPRIPVMGEDHAPTMTLQELWDWKAKRLRKSRFTTASEDLDLHECNRQIDELDSERETEIDWEEFEKNEQEMDACPSPTQRNHPAWTEEYQRDRKIRKYEERREQRKRLLSPPRTPPHLRGSGLYEQHHASQVPNSSSFRITKAKRDNRKAPRRPITRSYGTPSISLHDRKGYVKFWHTQTMYVVISYKKYLRDYVSLAQMFCIHVSNLRFRIEKSLMNSPGSRWISPTNIPNTHIRLPTSARYAGGAWRKIRKQTMQSSYLWIVGREISEVGQRWPSKGQEDLRLLKSQLGYIWWRQESISTEITEKSWSLCKCSCMRSGMMGR